MDKKFDFLHLRTAAQLAQLIDTLASNLRLDVINLPPITDDSDANDICKHDTGRVYIVTFCDSLISVVEELKSLVI